MKWEVVDGAQDVQWTSVMRRPEQSEDLEHGLKGRTATSKKRQFKENCLFLLPAVDGT